MNEEPAGFVSALKYVFVPLAVDELSFAGRKMALKTMRKYIAEMAVETGEKNVSRILCRGASKLVIPLSCLVGASINYYITSKFGRHCMKKYSKEVHSEDDENNSNKFCINLQRFEKYALPKEARDINALKCFKLFGRSPSQLFDKELLIKAVESGLKPVCFFNKQNIKSKLPKIEFEVITNGNYRHNCTVLFKEESRKIASCIIKIVQLPRGIRHSIGSEYHRILGRLYGYSEFEINSFITGPGFRDIKPNKTIMYKRTDFGG